MKTAKTFRLSPQAIEALNSIHQRTGANETAILELALILFQREIERSFSRGEDGRIGREETRPPAAEAKMPVAPASHQMTNNLTTDKKRRKRHR